MSRKYLATLVLFGALGYFLIPLRAFGVGGTATTPPNPGNFDIATIMANIISPLWVFFAGLTVIMFIVAGILFVTANGEPGKITTARNAFIWGVVGIIVSVVAFSIVQVVSAWV
jgi:hypothetical protein